MSVFALYWKGYESDPSREPWICTKYSMGCCTCSRAAASGVCFPKDFPSGARCICSAAQTLDRRTLLRLVGKVPKALEKLRTQTQYQLAVRSPRLPRTHTQKIVNRLLASCSNREREAKMTKATRKQYTLEFKQEAVRLVESGQSPTLAARSLGVSEQTLSNWVKAHRQGTLQGATSKPPVTAEQMEISRLRAELARV